MKQSCIQGIQGNVCKAAKENTKAEGLGGGGGWGPPLKAQSSTTGLEKDLEGSNTHQAVEIRITPMWTLVQRITHHSREYTSQDTKPQC